MSLSPDNRLLLARSTMPKLMADIFPVLEAYDPEVVRRCLTLVWPGDRPITLECVRRGDPQRVALLDFHATLIHVIRRRHTPEAQALLIRLRKSKILHRCALRTAYGGTNFTSATWPSITTDQPCMRDSAFTKIKAQRLVSRCQIPDGRWCAVVAEAGKSIFMELATKSDSQTTKR